MRFNFMPRFVKNLHRLTRLRQIHALESSHNK
jgi:hypothetical protein